MLTFTSNELTTANLHNTHTSPTQLSSQPALCTHPQHSNPSQASFYLEPWSYQQTLFSVLSLSLLTSSQGRSLGHQTHIGAHVQQYIPSTAHITRDNPFTIEPATPMVHFTKQGHVVQATGTAHLVFHFDLGDSLRTADQLLASSTLALDSTAEPQLIKW